MGGSCCVYGAGGYKNLPLMRSTGGRFSRFFILVLESSFRVVVVVTSVVVVSFVVASSRVGAVGSGFGDVYVDYFSVVFCFVQFADCFLCGCIVGHFNESESS